METLKGQGEANGVEGLELIGGNAARALEAELSCIGALSSPESGIIDSHGYMLALWGELEDRGGRDCVRNAGRGHVVSGIALAGHASAAVTRASLRIRRGDECGRPRRAGAGAAHRRLSGRSRFRVWFSPRATISASPASRLFARLIYPTPVDGGLGVHVTLDLAGRMRFGPDVEWIDHENYTVDPRRADLFYQRIRTYWPALPDGSLLPDYCGIRPKLTGAGEKAADFLIAPEAAHGMPRLINLFGIESPGLTSSLSLAEDVVDLLRD